MQDPKTGKGMLQFGTEVWDSGLGGDYGVWGLGFRV